MTAKKSKTTPKAKVSSAKNAELTVEANKRREVREVTTKLRHMGPVAKAEVVNQVVNQQVSRQVSGFTNFLREQSVIGIGIGLVLGTQIKDVVDKIMKSFVDPVTSLFLPGEQALTDKVVTVHIGPRSAPIGWGAIAYSLFSFIMVAIIVYAIYKMLKLDKLAKKKD
ncbi:MAG TPA: MscL family protein [Patescibacteria group bacterium]|nr:MscL family protein [Patescibacteria group bacterium]